MTTVFKKASLTDHSAIREAAEVIKHGGLVGFPTETVYGLGADYRIESAVNNIYRVKGRPADNPLILHICDNSQFHVLTQNAAPYASKLMDAFWPGPMTLVAPKSGLVHEWGTAGLDTVAVRFPVNRIAQLLIKYSDTAIYAPSANLSGKPSPTLAEHVLRDLNGKIEFILDGGPTDIGLESTVIDVTGEVPCILRPGYITSEMIKSVCGSVMSSSEVNGAPRAPGMKYKHYAPRADVTVISGEPKAAAQRINLLLKECHKHAGVLATAETMEQYDASQCELRCSGSRAHPASIAASLFALLRELDDLNVDVIFAEGIPEEGIGAAVMNRMTKSAGGKVIRV
jgi:L-threonylcarbamoyladenylate synthase